MANLSASSACQYCSSRDHASLHCPHTFAGSIDRAHLHCTFCGSQIHALAACPKIQSGRAEFLRITLS